MSETWDRRVCVARVRVLALHGLVAAGGEPTARQLRRSVEPVLGDLLPLPGTAEPDELDLAKAAAAAEASVDADVQARLDRPDAPTSAPGRPSPGSEPGPRCFYAVDVPW